MNDRINATIYVKMENLQRTSLLHSALSRKENLRKQLPRVPLGGESDGKSPDAVLARDVAKHFLSLWNLKSSTEPGDYSALICHQTI